MSDQAKRKTRRSIASGVLAVLIALFFLANDNISALGLSAPPPPQFVSAPLIPLTSSSQPSGAALDDVNGDSKLDLIVSENGSIDVYLGNGDGTFQSTPIVTTTSCGGGPLAVGNIQGASNPPGLVVSDTCGNAEVFFGKGDGTFQLNASYPEPYSGVTNPVYLADMNGDGLLDIFVNVSFMNQMAVLFNKPSSLGTFGTAQTINLSSVVSSPEQLNGHIIIANFTAGGVPDLALGLTQFGSPEKNSILVLLNNLTSTVSSGTSNDITSYFSAQPVITLTSASNTNAQQMSGLVAADFGNGSLDLLAGEPESGSNTGNYYFLEGNGMGSFNSPQTISNEPAPYNGGLISVDLNGSGFPDVVAVNGNDGITVLLNQGISSGQISLKTGESYVAAQYPQTHVAGVLTANGFASLAVPTGEGIAVMLGDGNGTLQAAPSFNAGNTPQNLIEMWNLNGQSETDLAMIDQTNNLVNFLTVPASGPNGTVGPPNPFFYNPPVVGETPTAIAGGCLKATAQPPSCASFLGMAAVDTNTADSNFGASDLEFVLSVGQPAPGVTVVPLPTDTDVQAMAVGDFNGDLNNDVAVALSTGEIEIFTGDGTGKFSSGPAITLTGSLDPIQLAAADFNSDGKPDIAVLDKGSNTSAGAVELFLNNTPSGGALSFQPLADYPLISSVTGATPWGVSMAVGDFNGDGARDVAVVNNDDDIDVFINSGGTGVLGALAPQSVFAVTGAIVAGDFDGDGKEDLAVVNSGSFGNACNTNDSVDVLTGNGDGTFNASNPCGTNHVGALFSAGSGPNSLVAGDFNGTDKYDLAVADNGGNSVTLLLQTAPPPPPASFTISPATVPAAWIGIPYSQTFTAPGATGTVTFSVTAGALPPGLSLASNGVLSGAATQANSFPFGISATASNGTVQQVYNLTVQDTFSLSPGAINFGTVTVGTTGTAQLQMTNAYSSTISWGFVFPVSSPFGATSTGSTCTGPLASGASCIQNLTYTPTAIGTVSAALCVLINETNVANACENVPLTGTGAASTQIAVPNVVGMTQSAATSSITAAGLSVGTVTVENSTTVAAGDVISENPAAGTLVTVGSSVDLVVSSGPPINETITVNDAVMAAPLSLVQPIAVAAPVAYFTQGSPLGFNSQSQSQQMVAISNIGQSSMTLDSIAVSSGPFMASLSNCFSGATATGATSATLPTGGFCTATITYTGSVPSTDTGTLVFTDNAALSNLLTAGSAPDYTQSITLTGSGTATAPPPAPLATVTIPTINETIQVTDNPAAGVPDFSLGTTTTSATVQPGATATYNMQLMPTGGFMGTVLLSCSGAPTESTCIAPAPVTLSGSSNVNIQVSIATTAPSLALSHAPFAPPPANHWLLLLSVLMSLLAGAAIYDRRSAGGERGSAWQPKRWRALEFASLAAILLCGALWVSCAGGGMPPLLNPPSGGTPTGTYTITVTATSGNLTHSQTITLVVQ